MQFQFLVEEALLKDVAYQSMLIRLAQGQQKCLEGATQPQAIAHCRHKHRQFDNYLSEYTYQFQEKGRKICGQSMGRGTSREHKDKVLQECVAFYQKSIGMFQLNVNNKLRSLVDNVDFSQL